VSPVWLCSGTQLIHTRQSNLKKLNVQAHMEFLDGMMTQPMRGLTTRSTGRAGAGLLLGERRLLRAG
jgi:hypothetical protein